MFLLVPFLNIVGIAIIWLLPLALLTVAAGTLGLLAARRLAQQAAHLVVVSAGTLLAAFALLLAILALAGPAWQRLEQPVFRDTSALVIALIVYNSIHVPAKRLQQGTEALAAGDYLMRVLGGDLQPYRLVTVEAECSRFRLQQ